MELGEEKGCDFDFKYRFLSKIDMMIYRLHDVVRTVSFSRDFQGNRFFLIDKRLKGRNCYESGRKQPSVAVETP